jgi:hypothetical protein
MRSTGPSSRSRERQLLGYPDSRLSRRQQPGRRTVAARPLLYGRQFQQRHDHGAAADEDHRARGRDVRRDAELDDDRSSFNTYPTYQSYSKDKAGKTNNYRRVTYYDGNLYFTKGSGGNGIDTVYTVSNPNGKLPTSATGSDATISVLPGLPTDSAKQTGANFTPFGLFFADPTTLYVADEGTGNTADQTTNAGLEKWTLSDGTWSLDYTLQAGLIGDTYSVPGSVPGWDYGETTIGLRNLTSEVNVNGTVTFSATTATTSGSGDNGADPNEIVKITDALDDTSLPTGETFSVFDGPVFVGRVSLARSLALVALRS